MACERNRILELKEYLLSLGICVNIGKNKARGHKGLFMHKFDASRIDIAAGIDNENILSVILHEFAHYIHFQNDKNLMSLDFIFDDFNDEIKEELVKITVNDVPKEFAVSLYSKKESLNMELKDLVSKIKRFYPDFKLSEKNTCIENNIKYPFKYLLKYDRINFSGKLYSVMQSEDYGIDEPGVLYILIKSKQRAIRRINARISKLNRYYNCPSELFARFLDAYYTKTDYTKHIAPNACLCLSNSKNQYIDVLNRIFM